MVIKFTEVKKTDRNGEAKPVASAKGRTTKAVKGTRKVSKAKTHVKKA